MVGGGGVVGLEFGGLVGFGWVMLVSWWDSRVATVQTVRFRP